MSTKIVELMSRDDSDVMKRLFVAAGGSYQAVANLANPNDSEHEDAPITRGIVANWFQRDEIPSKRVVDICNSLKKNGVNIKQKKLTKEDIRPDVFK